MPVLEIGLLMPDSHSEGDLFSSTSSKRFAELCMLGLIIGAALGTEREYKSLRYVKTSTRENVKTSKEGSNIEPQFATVK
ncbi:uncharacterized protein LOC113323883 isoform X3 [Papaver somniferum]|nr:uncharacterized protein LOC113323883 isoform X3 [Papaver somniferum]